MPPIFVSLFLSGAAGWMIAPPVITAALALVAGMTALIALPAGALRER